MKRPRTPMFVARRSYRVRRLRDAARLMPVLGAFLFLLLLLWQPAQGGERDLAGDAIFVFLVWTGLIVAAAMLARWLRLDQQGDDPAGVEDAE
jgi:uncharacterized membrane protein